MPVVGPEDLRSAIERGGEMSRRPVGRTLTSVLTSFEPTSVAAGGTEDGDTFVRNMPIGVLFIAFMASSSRYVSRSKLL